MDNRHSPGPSSNSTLPHAEPSWVPPDSWAVVRGEEPSDEESSSSEDSLVCNYPAPRFHATRRNSPGSSAVNRAQPAQRKYTIRVYRANNTYHVISLGFQVTVDVLLPKLNSRLLMGDREVYRLYLKEKGRERVLAPTERPANIVRRRLEQAGYDMSDGLELLGGEGLLFLLKFVYKSQSTGPAEEAIDIPSYTHVDLSGHSLRTIPVSLHIHAHEVISLSLSRNLMLEIPLDFIQSCTTLQELRLSNMTMKKVPRNVKHSSTLLRLDISCNRISDLDEAYLDQIPALEELFAQNNKMKQLPWYFPRLHSLVTLNISNNKFRAIPPVLCQLENLRDLDVSFNMIQELPEEIGQLRNLERFIIVGNEISKFPVEIRNFVSLRYLDCRRNSIRDLAEVCMLPNLETLNADHNALDALDSSLGPKLKCLDASHNEITKLSLTPRLSAGAPCALTTLDISSAKLSSLDDLAFAQLTTLRTLRLDHNSFTFIPETLGELQFLETLSCGDNMLSSLPASIGRLQNLQTLDAHCNSITEVPVTLWHCASLSKINLSSNMLVTWPATSISTPHNVTLETQDPEREAPVASQDTHLPPLAYSLQKLHLGENQLTDDVLHPLTILHELQVLNLSYNDLQDLPHNFFKNFSKLEELYLSGNKLSSIPTADLCKLTRLLVLYLNGNRFQTLPLELGKLMSLTAVDVGSNLLRYNINNWEFDWNWNFNKNLKYLNLSGNKRLEIKSDNSGLSGQRSGRDYRQQTLAGFTDLTQLRLLGLMNVTINANVDIPDESDGLRVRTSPPTVCGMSYGISDTLGKDENLHMIDLIHEFPERQGEAVFAMFSHVQPPKQTTISNSNRLLKYLRDRFVEVLLNQIQAVDPTQNEGIPDAMRRAFLKLNQDLHDAVVSPRSMSQPVLDAGPQDIDVSRSGASGVVLYFTKKKLYVANAGDTLAVVSLNGGYAVPVSQKHDPYDRNETARIRAAEGWVSSLGLVNDEIGVSRSFGLFHVHPMVNARPYVWAWDLTEHDELVIVGNRGLWDYMSFRTAVDIARRENNTMIAAQKLRDLAMSYGADGNIMVMVIGVGDLFKSDRAPWNSCGLRRRLSPLPRDGIIDMPHEVPAPTGHVAIVFIDILNSTHLWEVNPGTHTAIRLHNSLLRRQLRFCGGYEVKTEGDSFMCSFTSALSALWFCLIVQQQLLLEDWPLEILECTDGQPIYDKYNRLIARGLSVRMGIHCGTPFCEPDPITHRMDYYGPVVNRAAQINCSAQGGEIRCSTEVLREINSKIFGREPDTEYADTHPEEAIDAIKGIGVHIVDIGQVKMKGTEVPEIISAVYPNGLEERQFLQQEQLQDPKTHPHSGSRVAFSTKQMWALGMLCLRLEALATGRTFKAIPEMKGTEEDANVGNEQKDESPYFYGNPDLLLPPMNEKSSDSDLMSIMDSLVGRFENAIGSLSAKASIISKGP